MPRRARKKAEIVIELSFSTFSQVHMELRSGKVVFTLSNTAMSQPEEQRTLVAPKPTYNPTLYERAQVLTRGYLWFCIAASVLLLACGLVFFPQKTWNRLMMSLFGCVTYHIRGKKYSFCEAQGAAQDQGPAFL